MLTLPFFTSNGKSLKVLLSKENVPLFFNKEPAPHKRAKIYFAPAEMAQNRVFTSVYWLQRTKLDEDLSVILLYLLKCTCEKRAQILESKGISETDATYLIAKIISGEKGYLMVKCIDANEALLGCWAAELSGANKEINPATIDAFMDIVINAPKDGNYMEDTDDTVFMAGLDADESRHGNIDEEEEEKNIQHPTTATRATGDTKTSTPTSTWNDVSDESIHGKEDGIVEGKGKGLYQGYIIPTAINDDNVRFHRQQMRMLASQTHLRPTEESYVKKVSFLLHKYETLRQSDGVRTVTIAGRIFSRHGLLPGKSFEKIMQQVRQNLQQHSQKSDKNHHPTIQLWTSNESNCHIYATIKSEANEATLIELLEEMNNDESIIKLLKDLNIDITDPDEHLLMPLVKITYAEN